MTREDMLRECVTPDSEVHFMCEERYDRGRADALIEVKLVVDEIIQKYVELYGADIIELYSDVVSDLNEWIEEQLKEGRE